MSLHSYAQWCIEVPRAEEALNHEFVGAEFAQAMTQVNKKDFSGSERTACDTLYAPCATDVPCRKGGCHVSVHGVRGTPLFGDDVLSLRAHAQVF